MKINTMIRPILILIHLILLASVAEARIKQGFYVGALANYGNVDHKAVFGRSFPDAAVNEPHSKDYKSFGGGLVAGGWLALFGEDNPFRLGLETSLRVNKNHYTMEPVEDFRPRYERLRDSISFPYTYGVRLQAGCVVGKNKDWLLYGFVGGVLTQMNWSRGISIYNPTKEIGVPPHAPEGVYTPFAQAKRRVKGCELGIGVEKEIWRGHRLGLEVSRTMYNKVTLSSSDIGMPTRQDNQYTAKNRVDSVSLRYIVPM